MGQIILGAASSHAFAMLDPAKWDESRQSNRRGYERRNAIHMPAPRHAAAIAWDR